MKWMIALNFATAAVLVASNGAFARFGDDFFLLSMFLMACLLVLGLASLLAPMFLWRRRGPRSLLVPVSFVLALAAWYVVSPLAMRLALIGTPASPDSFLQGSTQADLEAIAFRLLDPDSSGELPSATSEFLEGQGFRVPRVDRHQRVVTFSHARMRTWYEYHFAPDSLPEHLYDRRLRPHWYFRMSSSPSAPVRPAPA